VQVREERMAIGHGPGLSATSAWHAAWPGARVGVLRIEGTRNPEADPALDALLDETAATLRQRFAGAGRADLLALPQIGAYAAYYRRFDKSYHVLLQLESVILKAKPLRARGVLVAAMFGAELETGLLTAGHDADLLEGPLIVDVVAPGDSYVGIGGREVAAARGDMCIRDGAGIVSSIVYGPDDRTRLRQETLAAVFTTYAPPGIGPDAVRRHLEIIATNVRTAAPSATVSSLAILEAGAA
jgi:DNA/RNA-binding domain of Phe-tRNA-synthetase-like protein